MNSFVRLWSKKRILRNGRLANCMVLIAFVFIPLTLALVFSQSMMNGIRDKYVFLSDGHIQTFEKPQSDEMIFSCDLVTKGSAIIYSDTNTTNLVVKGINEDYFNEKRMHQISIEPYNGESNLRKLSISETTAESLGVKPGDKIAMMAVSSGTKLRPVLIQVGDVFSTGYSQIDENLAFASYDWINEVFGADSYYEILLNTPYSDYADESAWNMGLRSFSTWDTGNTRVYSNFVASSQMIFLILLLVVAIAAFYTAMVSNQIVFDDVNEIETSKLLGTTDRQIRQSAFFSVMIIVIVGMLTGTVAGISLSFAINPLLSGLSRLGTDIFKYYLLDFDVIIPLKDILMLLASMIVLSAVAVRISLRRIKNISTLQLFTKL